MNTSNLRLWNTNNPHAGTNRHILVMSFLKFDIYFYYISLYDCHLTKYLFNIFKILTSHQRNPNHCNKAFQPCIACMGLWVSVWTSNLFCIYGRVYNIKCTTIHNLGILSQYIWLFEMWTIVPYTWMCPSTFSFLIG